MKIWRPRVIYHLLVRGKKSGEKEVAAADSLERMDESVLGSREGKEGSKLHTILRVCTNNVLPLSYTHMYFGP